MKRSQVCDKEAIGEDEVGPGCSCWHGEEVEQKKTDKLKTDQNKKRYKLPEVDEIINDFSNKKFAPQSRRKIKWAVNLYNGWRQNRIESSWPSVQIVRADLNSIHEVQVDDLSYA